jgi:DNA-binding MarR family transcriptional regulator
VPNGLAFQRGNWYLLFKAGALARQRWAAMLAELNVNPGQYGALMALGEAGRLGQHRLAELIGVDPRNAVPIVDALAEQGLVRRQMDPSDRRRRVLELTASGRAVAENLASVAAAIETDLLRPLAPDDQESLRRMLLTLLEAAKQPTD